MKSIIAALMLLVSFNALAFCPEELVCYSLSAEQRPLASANIPSQICLELLYINPENESIGAVAPSSQHLFDGLTLVSLKPKDEDSYLFVASNLINESWSSENGQRIKTELNIKGPASLYGNSDLKDVQISITEKMTSTKNPSSSYVKIFKYY